MHKPRRGHQRVAVRVGRPDRILAHVHGQVRWRRIGRLLPHRLRDAEDHEARGRDQFGRVHEQQTASGILRGRLAYVPSAHGADRREQHGEVRGPHPRVDAARGRRAERRAERKPVIATAKYEAVEAAAQVKRRAQRYAGSRRGNPRTQRRLAE